MASTDDDLSRAFEVVIDDLDGVSTADETIGFAFDGVSYEIDLTTAHADEFRRAVETYIRSARRVTPNVEPMHADTPPEGDRYQQEGEG